jgi:hypothetical protein
MKLRYLSLLAVALAADCTVLAGCTVDGPVDDLDAGPSFPDAQVDAPPRVDAGPPICEAGTTIGDPCETSAECSDGCFCNGFEVCTEGVCTQRPAPCGDEHDCTTDSCDEEIDRCVYVGQDEMCDDGDACNGAETCVTGRGCRPGPRLVCSDGDPCHIGSCDPDTGCSFTVRDLDADGHPDERCGGTDCDDDPLTGGTRFPGADEVCDNAVDDNCNDLTDYREPSCGAPNDTCATAEMLAGPGTYVRTTRGAVSDYPLGCRATGIDTVFRFTLATAQDVEVALSVESGTGAVAIRRGDGCTTGPDAYCGATEVLARDLAPCDYAIIVRTGTASTFSLTLTFQTATPVRPTDVCDASTVDISGGGTFTGFFSDVFHDYTLQCRTGTTTWKDVAYRLVLTEPSDVALVASTASTTSTTTYLSLVRDCTSADSTLACVQRASAEIRRRSLAPGVYYVLLESSSSTARTWTLDATITPALPRNEGDACSSEVDITNATATIPLPMVELDYGTSCGGTSTSSRDASFAFTLTDTQDVVLTTEVGGVHYVSLSRTCGDPSMEIACTSGTPRTTQRFLRLAPGTYHVTVSTGLTSGSITAAAMVEPPTFPPANDTCAGAIDLVDAVPVASSLRAAADDVASCGTAGSPDALHRLVLTETRNVTLVARRTDASTEPLSIGLRGECATPSSDLACASGTPALLNRTLPPGTYHVVVESTGAAAGPYSIVAYVAAP